MATNPYQLYATPFTEADQTRFVGFSCGDASWSRHVTEWILGSDVLDSMKRNTRVWLFETAENEIIGFWLPRYIKVELATSRRVKSNDRADPDVGNRRAVSLTTAGLGMAVFTADHRALDRRIAETRSRWA